MNRCGMMLTRAGEVLKEKHGKLSFGRVVGTVLIVFYLVWATYLTWETKKLVDIPSNLAMLIGALYGVNKLREAFGDRAS